MSDKIIAALDAECKRLESLGEFWFVTYRYKTKTGFSSTISVELQYDPLKKVDELEAENARLQVENAMLLKQIGGDD